ncbi:hypothetical protein [Acetivibrio ethanolgignens]|uniref:hypothetical protein n=1 Tax=Acetivibrio ethanolgignens TaxID=290052 RepID=UPI001FA7590C|nr:hypothetical protein [Acetivibrio ethanolgignens]
MVRKDIKIQINTILWENAVKKIETDFGKKYTKTDCMLIIMLLALYKKKNKLHSTDNLYLAVNHPDQLAPSAYKSMTIAVYDGLLDRLQEQHPAFTYNQLIESALADYLVLPITFYTDCISPLYTIVGSKNHTMQVATADAVDAMEIQHESFTLIDGCCATGSLFWGLKTYPWKSVVLNDLNPLRTNFLNVLKKEPLKLIKKLLETNLSFIEQPETKNPKLSAFKKAINDYAEKRVNYHKVDCDIDIAYKMFIVQCIDKTIVERAGKIMERIFRFLPAHLKLQNAIITQQDCLGYLKNDNTEKLLLLDVPYIGSEHTCAVTSYKYQPFHQKVAEYLQNAEYPFLYFCRSTPPKSDKTSTRADAEHIMKMKLGYHFIDKGYYFQKTFLKKDTELIISNQLYDEESQFQWTSLEQEII